MPVYDPFGINGGGATATAPTNYSGGSSGKGVKANAGRVYDPFNIGSVQAVPNPNAKTAQVQPKLIQQPPKSMAQKATSILSRVKNTVTGAVDDAKTTGEKALNTVGAGTAGVVGLTTAGVQAATGNKTGAKRTLQATTPEINEELTKGAGGKGAYLTPKEAKKGGTSLIKPTAQAVTDIAPYVVPVGAAAKGASLFAKIGKGALQNAIVSGATSEADQALNGGIKKSNTGETTKAIVTGGLLGGLAPLLHAGAKEGIAKIADKSPYGTTADAKDLARNTQTQALLKTADDHLPENHADYFNMDKKTQTLPVSELHLTHPADTQPESVKNASKLMSDAAFGGTKREPILVHADKSGTYTVLDGNATAAVAQKQGWKDIPVHIVNSENVPSDAHIDAAKMLTDRAKTEDVGFQAKNTEIAKSLGTEYHPGPVKSLGRTLTKQMDDYGGDQTKLKDTVRGTMVLADHSPQGIQKAVDTVKQHYPDATVKNGYERYQNGYKDVKVNITTPAGHKGEIILATPEMLKAKHDMGGHELYNTYRDATKPPSERGQAEQKMNALYNQADAATNKRLASGSDLPYSSSKNLSATAGETSRPASERTPGLEAPVKTTVSVTPPSGRGLTAKTTSSSEIKNLDRKPSITRSIAEPKENVKPNRNDTISLTDVDGSVSHYQLSGEALRQWKDIKNRYNKRVASLNNMKDHQYAQKQLKAEGMKLTAEKRRLTGNLTPREKYAIVAKERSAYVGKKVELDVGGKSAKGEIVSKPTYGNVRVKLEDGNVISVRHSELPEDERTDTEILAPYVSKSGIKDYTPNQKRPLTLLEKISEQKTNKEPKISARKQTEIKSGGPEPTIVPIKDSVRETTYPDIGVPKLAEGVEQGAIKKGLTEGFANKPEYAKVNIKQQSGAATDLVKSDPERAYRIAMGLEHPPEGLLPESAFIAVEHAATKTGNTELLRKLATESHLTSEATGMGQRIRMLGERDTNSAVSNIKRVSDARTAAFERKNKTTAVKATSDEIKAIRAAKATIPKPTKETFASFVDSLKC